MESKTRPPLTSNHSIRLLKIAVLLFAIGLISLSCSNDDDRGPDTRALFVGNYSVEDISGSSGYTYNYDIGITSGSNGELEVSNFADIFNVPVKATVNGKTLTIKSQSFTNPSSGNTIEVSGSGSLEGEVLSFTYVTTGYLDYTGTCTATKN